MEDHASFGLGNPSRRVPVRGGHGLSVAGGRSPVVRAPPTLEFADPWDALPTVRPPLSTGPSGSASRTRSSAPATPTTASAARAAGSPVPRSVGGCNGPATTAGALLEGEGVGVGCPAR